MLVSRLNIIKSTLFAVIVAAASSLGVSSASAGGYGGDCCADLEERVAELESTTVRKGNRKVSLKLSGWVSEQVVSWDDGVESNTYITGLGTAFATNFNLTGSAEIAPGWSAGFVLWVEADGCDVYTTSQDVSCGPFVYSGSIATPQTLYSYWFIESDDFGKVSVGQHSPADDSAVVAIDASGTLAAAYWVAYDVFSFQVRGNFDPGQSVIWGQSVSCRGYGGGPGDCNGIPRNVVRYDTPTWYGFSGTASFGLDDNYAGTIRYVGELTEDLRFSAVATYSTTSDSLVQGAPVGGELRYTQAAVYAQHLPTGLFALGAWGHLDQSRNVNQFPETDAYYVKGGIRLDLISALGSTIPYGEYLLGEDGVQVNDSITGDFDIVNGSESTYWGLGVVQDIDAAAMQMWLRYRRHDLDLPGVHTKGIETVVFGSFINF